MRCSGCGKDIPFAGEVCPHCQRDKSNDQAQHTVIMVCIIACMGLGYLFNDFTGLMWGAGIGLVLAVIAGISMGVSSQSKPPEVRVVTEEPPSSPPVEESTFKKRLSELEALRNEGLITESEFNAKRQRILDEL